MTNRNHLLLAIGLLIVLAALGIVMRNQIPPRIDLPFDVPSTILAAEFANTPTDINAVFGAEHRYAPQIKTIQFIDFVFIPCYVALFVLMGWNLRRYDIPAPAILSWIVVGAAVLAGVLDIAENITVLGTANNSNSLTSHVRNFSVPKFGLVFLVMLLESVLFLFWPRLKLWWRLGAVAVGFMFLFAGAAGLLFTLLLSIHDLADAAMWMSWALTAALVFFVAFVLLKKPRAH